jgi:phage shock protein A
MLKTVITLIRGSTAAAAEDLADRNALLILDQQMRDAQASLGRAQRALAMAIAEDAQEGRRIDATSQRIASLEDRARAALAGSRQDLALEAAEAIAALEAERDSGRQARSLFATEIARLRRDVADAERRLAALQRGRRVARVAEAVRVSRRGRIEAAGNHECTLSEAEATLARLRERQVQAASAEDALDTIAATTRPQTVEDRLAEAGFGPPARPTAASVLARLAATHQQGATP